MWVLQVRRGLDLDQESLATDHSGTYYNPAGLAFTQGSAITLGFSYAGLELDYDAEAFVGLGSMHVESTRLIKGEDGISDL